MTKHYSYAKQFAIGEHRYTISVTRHWIRARTNGVKVWSRYTGCLVLQGTGTYEDWNGETHHVAPGMFVHHLPEKFHHITRDDENGWEECALEFDSSLYGRFRDLGWIDDSRGVVKVGTSNEIIDAFARLAQLVSNNDERGNARILSEAGRLIFRIREIAESLSVKTKEEMMVDVAVQQLNQDFRCEIDLAKLAADTGYSYPQFRRLFFVHKGMSPNAYRLQQRMEQAKLLLEYRQSLVSDIAEQLGYSDQFVFSRQFKKYVGISPKRYALERRMR